MVLLAPPRVVASSDEVPFSLSSNEETHIRKDAEEPALPSKKKTSGDELAIRARAQDPEFQDLRKRANEKANDDDDDFLQIIHEQRLLLDHKDDLIAKLQQEVDRLNLYIETELASKKTKPKKKHRSKSARRHRRNEEPNVETAVDLSSSKEKITLSKRGAAMTSPGVDSHRPTLLLRAHSSCGEYDAAATRERAHGGNHRRHRSTSCREFKSTRSHSSSSRRRRHSSSRHHRSKETSNETSNDQSISSLSQLRVQEQQHDRAVKEPASSSVEVIKLENLHFSTDGKRNSSKGLEKFLNDRILELFSSSSNNSSASPTGVDGMVLLNDNSGPINQYPSVDPLHGTGKSLLLKSKKAKSSKRHKARGKSHPQPYRSAPPRRNISDEGQKMLQLQATVEQQLSKSERSDAAAVQASSPDRDDNEPTGGFVSGGAMMRQPNSLDSQLNSAPRRPNGSEDEGMQTSQPLTHRKVPPHPTSPAPPDATPTQRVESASLSRVPSILHLPCDPDTDLWRTCSNLTEKSLFFLNGGNPRASSPGPSVSPPAVTNHISTTVDPTNPSRAASPGPSISPPAVTNRSDPSAVEGNIHVGDVEGTYQVTQQEVIDPYNEVGIYTGSLSSQTHAPHGFGLMVYSENAEQERSYEGEWLNGRWHGRGKLANANGDFYVGMFEQDVRHGEGTYHWASGRTYAGSFLRDKRHGWGVITFPDGSEYRGHFRHGAREGKGRCTFADGGYYDGEWRNNTFSGTGECVWPDGRLYRGDFFENAAHGYGVEYNPDGTIRHEGLWDHDNPVE